MIYQYFNVPGIMKLTQEILLLNGPKKRGADTVKWDYFPIQKVIRLEIQIVTRMRY